MKNSLWLLLPLLLLGCDDAATSSAGVTRPALTREQLLNPETCKDCHPKHYTQWSASMHAYAGKDPVFLAMNKRGQEATGNTLKDFCVNCHLPMAVRENAITDYTNLQAVPEHLQGVTCYFCHNATGVGPSHVNGDVNIANDNVMRGPIRNALEPTTHKVAYSQYHDSGSDKSSELCGSCHDILTPLGVRLERTFEEYKGSIVATPNTATSFAFQSCQDCHMKRLPEKQPAAKETGRPGELVKARDLHEHLWAAVDVPLTDFPFAAATRSAVEACELQGALSSYFTVARDPGPLGTLTITLETNAGHNMPSGAAQDRRLWVELTAFDASNKELFSLGVIGDQQIEETKDQPHPCLFREYLLDDKGQETHMFWEAASIDMSRSRLLPTTPPGGNLKPGGHSRECTFRPPVSAAAMTPDHIDLRVRLRPMGLDVLQDLVKSGHLAADIPQRMPTFTVSSYRATYSATTGNYSIIDTSPGDCESYRCVLDPEAPACKTSTSSTAGAAGAPAP